ncbi:MAG: hypothetical protein MJY79_04060 [Bacteroidaceae bacterium]|nr:hypothetical protein [Bacteroidaceae bacterium]
MEIDVLAADSLLNTIEPPASGRSLALYSLLRTQIDYKLYRDISTDSIIRIATDFYGTKRKDYHAAMAWYSLGCISGELGDDVSATGAYLTAMPLFPDTLVRYYALCEQNLGYIYLQHNMDEEAIDIINRCHSNAVRLGDSTTIAFCELNVAKSLLFKNDYDSAKSLFLSLKDNPWMSPSTRDIPLLELAKISVFHEEDYNMAISYIDSFVSVNRHQYSYGTAYSLKAETFKRLNLNDSARHYFRLAIADSSDPYTICNSYRALAGICSEEGDSDSTRYYTRLTNEWTDSIVSVSNSSEIFRTLLTQSVSQRQKKRVVIPLFISLCLLSVIMMTFHNLRKKHEGQSNDADPFSPFEKDLESFKESELFKTMAKVTTLQKEPDYNSKNSFINEYRTALPELRTFLKTSGPLNNNEIDYCVFTILGFQQKDYHLLFNLLQSRTMKHRLKEKLPESLYLAVFERDYQSVDIQ